MKNRIVLFIMMLILVLYSSAFAVMVEVQGVVIDKEKGEPLPFANVFIKGTSIGAATDRNGIFTFVYETDKEFTVAVRFMG